MTIARQFWVIAHRWAGLTIALFLVIAGLTGSVLTFYEELHRATAPQFAVAVPPSPDAQALDPLIVRERIERASGARLDTMQLDYKPGHVWTLYPSAALDGSDLEYDEIAIDPYRGDVQGTRTWGAITEGWHNTVPFLYKLHYTLAAGEWGGWALGIAALIWTIDCFIGFYLSLPVSKRGRWRRWRRAWSLRRPVKWGHKLNFDLHVAGGLWVWPLLLVFAWSSVGFNLPQIYEPVTRAMVGPRADQLPKLVTPVVTPKLNWMEARDRARVIAAELGRQEGFDVLGEQSLTLDRAHGVWRYGFRSSRENLDHKGQSRLFVDTQTGALKGFVLPSGQNARATFESWLFGLHMAQVWGLPYRIFVCALGLLITMLSVTGVLIWMKKRSARIARGARVRRPVLAPAE